MTSGKLLILPYYNNYGIAVHGSLLAARSLLSSRIEYHLHSVTLAFRVQLSYSWPNMSMSMATTMSAAATTIRRVPTTLRLQRQRTASCARLLGARVGYQHRARGLQTRRRRASRRRCCRGRHQQRITCRRCRCGRHVRISLQEAHLLQFLPAIGCLACSARTPDAPAAPRLWPATCCCRRRPSSLVAPPSPSSLKPKDHHVLCRAYPVALEFGL